MNHTIDQLFPDDLSDKAASRLTDFLHELALACDRRYFKQCQCYHDKKHRKSVDPQAPWKSLPLDF